LLFVLILLIVLRVAYLFTDIHPLFYSYPFLFNRFLDMTHNIEEEPSKMATSIFYGGKYTIVSFEAGFGPVRKPGNFL